ncbi:hypothetical protein GDO78_018050 [Eleutherodactylus coqui]|uniref:Uncharacterized protein n=1 Tax=Eleutherodactylus coqui TaxID=57060 RepID=A0A8J6EJP4_ELECQ|nr:hypothetical protein GDO78_018050 [Eleutherodactylus coqui]
MILIMTHITMDLLLNNPEKPPISPPSHGRVGHSMRDSHSRVRPRARPVTPTYLSGGFCSVLRLCRPALPRACAVAVDAL